MADEPTPPAPVEAPSEDVPQAELAGPTPEPSPAPSREEVTAPAEEASHGDEVVPHPLLSGDRWIELDSTVQCDSSEYLMFK